MLTTNMIYTVDGTYTEEGALGCQTDADVSKAVSQEQPFAHIIHPSDTLPLQIHAVKAGAVRTLQAEAVDAAGSACDRAEELADLILNWPADGALPDAVQSYATVKVADVVDAWNRYDVPEWRFEVRLTPLIEIRPYQEDRAAGRPAGSPGRRHGRECVLQPASQPRPARSAVGGFQCEG